MISFENKKKKKLQIELLPFDLILKNIIFLYFRILDNNATKLEIDSLIIIVLLSLTKYYFNG